MVETTPESSAGKAEVGGEAEGTMQRQEGTSAGYREPFADAAPKSGQGANEEDAPAKQSHGHDQDLQPKGLIVDEPVTRAERISYLTLGATALLAVGTVVLALATWDMARSTRSLVDLARQQAHDTQDALVVSRRQAEAAETANRLISASEISISTTTLPGPTVGAKLSASFGVFNIGRSPATELQGQAVLLVLPPPQLPKPLADCPLCGKQTLFPTAGGFNSSGISFNASMPVDRMSEATVSAIKAGSINLYMLGRVDYLGSDKTRHTILLCDVFVPELDGSGPCASGNDAR